MIVQAARPAALASLDASGLPFADAALAPMPRWTQRILGGRVAAITLGPLILVEPSRFGRMANGEEPELLAHELIHVAQWRRDGVRAFVMRYLGDYVRLRILGLDHVAAYRHIGYEWAAYSGARHIVDAL